MTSAADAKAKFVSSKWEEVDPEKVEKQAITTSKWDFFDAEKDQPSNKLTNLTSYGSDDDDDEREHERITPMSTDDEKSNQRQQQHEKNGDSKKENDESDDEDIDGEPIDDQDDSRTKDKNEPSDTQTQTSLTKKPDEMTQSSLSTPPVTVTVIDEEKRKVLREIEVKIVKYIDEIESGKVRREQGVSIQEQAEKYRQELIRKVRFFRIKKL